MDHIDANDIKLVGAEPAAKRVLEELGFTIRKIPTSSQRTADFDVMGDEPAYFVEVKSRLLDERVANPAQPYGELVEKPMRHDAKVGNWLADARQQFRTLDPEHARLWFIWCSMESRFGRMNQIERAISVLYGVREAHDVEPPHRSVIVFYAMPAAFDRFPEIDGAVVVVPGDTRMTFCPNEKSPRFDAAMRSKLVRSLRNAGVRTMLTSERAVAVGGYVVPENVRGSDRVTILRHVQRATGLPYLNFMAIEVEVMQSGRITLPSDAPDL
jgi:hypothetical protein